MATSEKTTAERVTEERVGSKHSNEPFFGTLLFSFLALILLAVVAGAAWGVYRGFRLNQEQTALPSIGSLSVQEEKVETPEPPKTVKETPTSQENPQVAPDATVLLKAKGTDVKVLNGGAAKGSAGTVAESLKKAGFTKVTSGNALKDYTGVTVYYAAGLDKEAQSLKMEVAKTYPKAEAKAALKDNAETTQANLTVILGK